MGERMKFSEYMKIKQCQDHDERGIIVNDKIKVKDYVGSVLGDNNLFDHRIWSGYDENECIDIMLKNFPCVVKVNHSWRRQKFIFDKSDAFSFTEEHLLFWKDEDHGITEWAYKYIEPGFLIEKIMPLKHDMIKVFCFYGKPAFFWHQTYDVSSGKVSQLNATMYDALWGKVDTQWNNTPNREVEKLKNFDDLYDICKKISEHWQFLRCDFYIVDDNFYVSEITHYHANGTNGFSNGFDEILGGFLE